MQRISYLSVETESFASLSVEYLCRFVVILLRSTGPPSTWDLEPGRSGSSSLLIQGIIVVPCIPLNKLLS